MKWLSLSISPTNTSHFPFRQENRCLSRPATNSSGGTKSFGATRTVSAIDHFTGAERRLHIAAGELGPVEIKPLPTFKLDPLRCPFEGAKTSGNYRAMVLVRWRAPNHESVPNNFAEVMKPFCTRVRCSKRELSAPKQAAIQLPHESPECGLQPWMKQTIVSRPCGFGFP